MQDLNKPLTHGYQFNLNSYIKAGWELFKAHAGSFIGMSILFFVILIIVGLIPLLGSLYSLLSTLLFAGFFVFCRNTQNQSQDTSDFFKGFHRAGQIILYQIVYAVFLIPFFLLFFTFVIPFDALLQLINQSISEEEFFSFAFEEISDRKGLIAISILTALIGTIYLSVSYIFTLPLIVDTKLDFWQSMELSRKVVGKKFFQIFISLLGLGIVFSLAMVITCGLATLIAVPLGYTILFSAYDHIFEPYKDEFQSDLDAFGEKEKNINTESQEKTDGEDDPTKS